MFRKITFSIVGLFFLGWIIFEIRKSNKIIEEAKKEEEQQQNLPVLTVEQQQALQDIDYTSIDWSTLNDLDFSNMNFGNFGAMP